MTTAGGFIVATHFLPNDKDFVLISGTCLLWKNDFGSLSVVDEPRRDVIMRRV